MSRNRSKIQPNNSPAESRNGLRQPDWRWYLAWYASVEHKELNPKYYDATTIELADYLRGGDELIPVPSLTGPVSAKSIVSIHEDRLTRLTFESRVLGYRDLELAAERTGISVQLAKAYCDVFFDVSDRLDATRAIDGAVIEARRDRSDDLRHELYRSAYFAGPVVAEHWIRHLPALVAGVEPDLSCPKGIEREQLALSVLWSQVYEKFYIGKPMEVFQRLLEQQPQARTYSDTVFDRVVHVLASDVGCLPSSDAAKPPEQAARKTRHPRKSQHAA